MKQRVSLITLGVRDLGRARRFYEDSRLGLDIGFRSAMADSSEAPESEPVPDPVGPDAPASIPPGWYPDPNAGGANLMRYWDGGGWTDQRSGGQRRAQTPHAGRLDERKVILAQQRQTAAARGLLDRVPKRLPGGPRGGQARQPRPDTAILTIFTCLLWGIVWAIIAANRRREPADGGGG